MDSGKRTALRGTGALSLLLIRATSVLLVDKSTLDATDEMHGHLDAIPDEDFRPDVCWLLSR